MKIQIQRAALAAFFVVAAIMPVATGCGNSSSTTPPAPTGKLYTCTMHPEVVTNQPGKCPKCGMDLVEKK